MVPVKLLIVFGTEVGVEEALFDIERYFDRLALEVLELFGEARNLDALAKRGLEDFMGLLLELEEVERGNGFPEQVLMKEEERKLGFLHGFQSLKLGVDFLLLENRFAFEREAESLFLDALAEVVFRQSEEIPHQEIEGDALLGPVFLEGNQLHLLARVIVDQSELKSFEVLQHCLCQGFLALQHPQQFVRVAVGREEELHEVREVLGWDVVGVFFLLKEALIEGLVDFLGLEVHLS